MKTDTTQGLLFPDACDLDSDSIPIGERCRLQTRDGYRVLSVAGLVVTHYAVGDRLGEAHAMVTMVEQGWALQTEVARAFGCSVRTVRRHQERVAQGGLVALGRPRGCPKDQRRVSGRRDRKVARWKAGGHSNREIGRRLGVTEKAVRKQLRRLGWESKRVVEPGLPFMDADPKLSGGESEGGQEGVPEAGNALDPRGLGESGADEEAAETADPKLSGGAAEDLEAIPVSLDRRADDRSVDRTLACLGLLDDAAPMFGASAGVRGAGVLLALPSLVGSGVIEVSREVYGSVGPAFFGLRTTVLTLLLMALLRIRRPEGLKEESPRDLGCVLGLDRGPEVKTLRRKLARLAAFGRAAQFGRALAERRVAARGRALGFLYVDGHVRVYHGQRVIPKAHVTRLRISMPAMTDYWVNDAGGEPLFVVPTEANRGLVEMLPSLLEEVRGLVGQRRVTVVFDRGGWSPRLFKKLINEGFDILTYRKAPRRSVARKRFKMHTGEIDGRTLRYRLADQGIRLGCGLRLRQVTRLTKEGHQTPIVTSRRDLSALEVAYRMFSRWRQENFFKYLREEYALDALISYGVEAADAAREVPNPARARIDTQLRLARAKLQELEAQYGLDALLNPEELRRTMRGFKIANAESGRRIVEALKKVADLEHRRSTIPARIPVGEVVPGEVRKLEVERKHLTDLLKMVAYQAESDLVRMLAPRYRRAEEEGRTLVQNALAASGDITVVDDELRVDLDPLSSPHRTQALASLCDALTATRIRFPGSRLRLRFAVKPQHPPSLAFPGPREKEARK